VIFTRNGFQLGQCPVCKLAYVLDPPSSAELKRLYSFDSGYHTAFREDDSEASRSFLALGREYCDLIERYRTRGSLLDVGCSAGFFLKAARDRGWETCGVEMSADTAALARERHGLRVITGALEEAELAASSFDVVTMWDVIEHLEDPRRALLEVSRVLKRGGLLALATPNLDGLFPRLSLRASGITGTWPHPEPPHHLFQFSKRTIRALLEQTGFEILDGRDKRLPLAYTFGTLRTLVRSPRRLLYAACFVPLAWLGPLVHSGDWMIVIARSTRGV
jgi:2-polyprenyl-3-methyl-5-hydroxy-6-metoxy-1,4-benzoquinol methylase